MKRTEPWHLQHQPNSSPSQSYRGYHVKEQTLAEGLIDLFLTPPLSPGAST